ncbi:MAG: DNA gyrase inhibitor YacG [Roseobacter sp.]
MSCPMCGKPTVQKVRPFCSKRCADLDLARWFNGSYAVPSQDMDDISDLEEALEKAQKDDLSEKPH